MKNNFRAKAMNKGEWVYGYYVKSLRNGNLVDVITDGANEIPIQFDTLGQATGMFDSHWNEIYEGDILKYGNDTFKIVFCHGAFGYVCCKQFIALGTNTNFSFCKKGYDNDFEIIGNIYDNEYLMKQT